MPWVCGIHQSLPLEQIPLADYVEKHMLTSNVKKREINTQKKNIGEAVI